MFSNSNISTEQLYAKFLDVDVITTDSREVCRLTQKGKKVMFFCLKGENFNGNNFIDDVLNSGASYVLSDCIDRVGTSSVLKTDDVLTALQRLANHHRRSMRAKFIALTGSNGKTTTKELMNAVLSKKYSVLCTKGNLNNHIGVPLTILSVNSTHDIAIIEQGANHQGEIAALSSISEPNYGLITNIGRAHLDGFGGVEGVVKGKGELFDFLHSSDGVAFFNSEIQHLSQMVNERGGLKSVGFDSSLITNNDLSTIDGISFNYAGRAVSTHLSGEYNLQNILSAIAIGKYFGVEDDDISDAISEYEPQNMRSQVVKTASNRVVVDAYNANPSSMQVALDNFNRHAAQKKCYILGQMNELGEYSLKEHASLVSSVQSILSADGSDIVIFVGKEFKGLVSAKNAVWFETTTEVSDYIKNHNLTGYDILLKGSRGVGLEKLLDLL